MTEFQLGLLGVGVLAVVGVLVYNRLQERAARRSAAQLGGERHADALLGGGSGGERREPTLERWPARARREAASDAAPLPDARLDYVVELEAQSPIPGAALLETLSHRFPRGAVFAAAAHSPAEGWRPVGATQAPQARRLRAALQLVTRAGRIGEAELIEFRSLIETFGAKFGATVGAPEMKQALETARALDELCAQTDIQIALHVTPPAGQALDAGATLAAARSCGLDADADGRLVHRDAEGRVLYAAAPPDAGAAQGGLVLLMDVPHVPDPRRVYESMVRCARRLAAALGGDVRDDNGRVLDEAALAAIEAELAAVREALERGGFAPGGTLALRLFS